MGILSEMDMMNRDAEDDAFEVSSDSETVDSFSEEFEPVEPPKPDPQAEDAEEARKKAEFDAAEAKRKAEWEAKQAQKKLHRGRQCVTRIFRELEYSGLICRKKQGLGKPALITLNYPSNAKLIRPKKAGENLSG